MYVFSWIKFKQNSKLIHLINISNDLLKKPHDLHKNYGADDWQLL